MTGSTFTSKSSACKRKQSFVKTIAGSLPIDKIRPYMEKSMREVGSPYIIVVYNGSDWE